MNIKLSILLSILFVCLMSLSGCAGGSRGTGVRLRSDDSSHNDTHNSHHDNNDDSDCSHGHCGGGKGWH